MKTDPRLPKNPFNFFQRAGYNFFQVLDHFITRPVTIKLFGKLRYALFLNMVESLKKKGEGKIIPVERRDDLTVEEFFNYYVKNGIPVIFSGAAKNWGCATKWSLDYFKDLHGDDEVPLIDSSDFEKGVEFTTLRDLIDRIGQGNTKAYFRFYNLLVRHPEHLADFDMNWLRGHRHKLKYFESFQVFIGGKNSITDIHNSHIANLFVQAYGEKHWILYPFSYVPFIDPPSTENGIYRNAPARVNGQAFKSFAPDFEAYPYYKYIDGYRVELKPGDVFYNPPYMWHTVRNQTDSIGVGFRWINPWHSFSAHPVYFMLDLMAYRPNYFSSLIKIKKDANRQFIDRFEKMQKYMKTQQPAKATPLAR